MPLKSIKEILLLTSVFITGAAVLIVEIIAMRILPPYYGNTIYTTSSVIGTVLAALSLGYYFGGKISDRYPYYGLFYGIIFFSGSLVILMQVLIGTVLPLMGLLFSIMAGPLVSSALLFFIPPFFLGMLSPFAIKLHKKEENNIGSRSGEVFFWSTMGSIMGSLLSGFVLIPFFGIDLIIIGTGAILVLWGLAGLVLFKTKNKPFVAFMAFAFVLLLLVSWMSFPKKDKSAIYEKDGLYEKIKISDGKWNGQSARFLFQDKSHSAAMYLNSEALAYEYTKYYKLYELFIQSPKDAFVIGGGAYSIPKALLSDLPEIQVDVAEIEPELFNLAKKYFNLKDNPRLVNHIEDGRRFLARNQKKYDLMVSDVYYSFFQIPVHFTTKEFFSLAKNRLSENGVFIGNFAGSASEETPSLILSEIKTFKEIFPNSYFFAVVSPELKEPQNIIFLGANSKKDIDFNGKIVLENNNPIIRNLPKKNIDLSRFDLSLQMEITDNFSPVEYLAGKFINKWY